MLRWDTRASFLIFKIVIMIFFLEKDSFIYSWLCWVFVVVCGLSLFVTGVGYSCCGAQALGARA